MNTNYKAKSSSKISISVLAILALILFGATIGTAAPGDLDPTFGSGGRIPPPSGSQNISWATGVVVQPDQKIVVLGTDNYRIVLTRFLPNGILDPSFGTGGRVYTDLGGTNVAVSTDLVLQTDGRIIVTATRFRDSVWARDAFVLRYLSDGSLDPTFDGDGKLLVPAGFEGFVTTSCRPAIQSDGKILLSCGEWLWEDDYWKFILRLDPDGSIDTTFGGGGRVYLDANDFEPFHIAIQSDGKTVAADSIRPDDRYVVLTRLKMDGSLDTSFGNSGWVVTPGGELTAIVLQPDNKIVVAGYYVDPPTTVGGRIIRYLSDGSLDTSFGGAGIVSLQGGTWLANVAVQPNGKILAGGSGNQGHLLARLLRNGALDQNFGTNGLVTTLFPNLGTEGIIGGHISDLTIQDDGKIIGVGVWGASSPVFPFDYFWSYQAIARYIGDSVEARRARFDFDGDGRSDISVFRPSDRVWYLNQSSAGFTFVQFGLSADRLTPADFDGDGKTDIAVFRDGTWYLLRSTAGFLSVQFGQVNDVSQPADFNGDGRAELAVYRDGNYFTLNLANNQVNTVQFGISSDKPVVGDYDGDGRADYAVYRAGTWYLLRSTQGFTSIQFGLSTDRVVPADYDGDGKTDPAVYRDGTWYVFGSQTGFTTFQFGLASDIPAPADYDGDGRTDAAVYRDGVWHLRQSTAGTSSLQFGQANDTPIPSAYVP